jgi:hypothetical protein
MGLPRFLTSGRFLTGIQIAGGIAGTIATVSVTKTILGYEIYCSICSW